MFAGTYFEVIMFLNRCSDSVDESKHIGYQQYRHSIINATGPNLTFDPHHWSSGDFCPICSDMNLAIWEILVVYVIVMTIFRPLQHLHAWYYTIPLLDISHVIAITYFDLRITGQLIWNFFIKMPDLH